MWYMEMILMMVDCIHCTVTMESGGGYVLVGEPGPWDQAEWHVDNWGTEASVSLIESTCY